jgi:uncharacterized RDD family membrane protein YckC
MDQGSPEQRRESPPGPRCSFCGEVQTSNIKMIKGPGVYICEECVAVCQHLMNDAPEDRADTGGAGEPAPPPPRPSSAIPPELPPAPSQPPPQPPVPPQTQPPGPDSGERWHPGTMPPPPATVPGQVVAEGVIWAPAGFWRRFGAFLIDGVVLFIAAQIALAAIGFTPPSEEQQFEIASRALSELMASGAVASSTLAAYRELLRPLQFAGWLNVFICMAYFTVFHGMLGATLGKLCLGIRVLRRDGSALTYGWAWLRYLGYFLVAKLVYTAWLIPFTAERRTLYDIVLGTNVFRQLAPAPQSEGGQLNA